MKKKMKKKVKKFFSSYTPILISLILLIVVLLIYCNYLMKSSKTYMFNGSGDYVDIYNGVISMNYDINILEGSDITYTYDEDIVVVKYTIGYYVKDSDNLISIVAIEDEDEEGFSLKAVLEGISTFNITELNKNDKHFNKDTAKLLNNGLYFVIEAEDLNGEKIADITTLDLTKLSK